MHVELPTADATIASIFITNPTSGSTNILVRLRLSHNDLLIGEHVFSSSPFTDNEHRFESDEVEALAFRLTTLLTPIIATKFQSTLKLLSPANVVEVAE